MPARKPAVLGEQPSAPEPLMRFVGHASIVERFARMGPERLAHAYLFHGPRGVGKTTFARTIALTLHCQRPTSFPLGYCGTCSACRRGLIGESADTIIVDTGFIRLADEIAEKPERKTDTIGIETSRLIIRRMQLRSYEGGRSVCIIPDFENVPSGQDHVYNALLKELEEPDAGKVFFLTTDSPERILPTIRSRTNQIRFGGLSESEIAGALVESCGETPERAALLARRAQGSLGAALAERDDRNADLRVAARRWALACLREPSRLPPMPSLGKEDPRPVLESIFRHARSALRDLMLYALAGDAALFDPDAAVEYRATATALGADAAKTAAAALALFADADRIAATNVTPSAVLGWLQIQLRAAAGG